jgi:hypothetical protein
MASSYIESAAELISQAVALGKKGQLLFRGQDCDGALLPKIARDDPSSNTVALERKMLEELRRRAARASDLRTSDDWDALVIAQHFGMATRLLDWTTNPLVALWFASADRKPQDGFVYMLIVTEDMILDRRETKDPFAIKYTKVFKPSLNNERVISQSGWFTAHPYSGKVKRFVDLHKNKTLPTKVLMKGVRGSDKDRHLSDLDRVGINQESMFPGLEGTCRYVDWMHRYRTT